METIDKIYSLLRKDYKKFKTPVAQTISEEDNNPFKILISTILSARTKDTITLEASNRLFRKAHKLSDLEKLSTKEIEELIYPVGFYKTKARHLKKLPSAIKTLFLGQIPITPSELMKLPGVGRKTANLVSTVAFGYPAICVDTHVHRITNRLGLVKTKTPKETELTLMTILPKRLWQETNHLLVSFGQNICLPISPYCSKCCLRKECPKINVKSSR